MIGKRMTIMASAIAMTALAFTSASALEKATLRLDFAPVGMHAAFHLAKEKGWFEEEGIDLTIEDGSGSLNTLQLVGAGQVEIGLVSQSLVAMGRENDLKVKSFFGVMRKGDMAVVVPRDGEIKQAGDLAGQNLICFANSPWVPYMDAFFEAAGLSSDDLEVTMVAPAAMLGIYSSMGADGVLTTAAHAIPLLENDRPSNPIFLSDYGISLPGVGLIATEDTIANRPDLLRGVVKVVTKAWTEVRDNGAADEAVAAMQAQRPNVTMDAALLKSMLLAATDFLETDATEGKPLGWQADSDWESALDAMVSVNVLKAKPELADIFTNEFIPQ